MLLDLQYIRTVYTSARGPEDIFSTTVTAESAKTCLSWVGVQGNQRRCLLIR